MTRNEQQDELNPMTLILGLGYATTILVAIGWIATL